MLSALKKKLGTSSTQPLHGSGGDASKMPTGVNPISAELQKKFANGVNYNMKIVIRGDRNSGKTCLWKRIQGKPFTDEYFPTAEIQAANIVWNYRASDFIVKIDVWDVVDESPKRRVKSEGLKLQNVETPEYEAPACDAGFVDVYKNCNGVLMVFDITKPWTWNYVERELEKVPSHIPVLIVSNKMDLEDERQVREDDVQHFLSQFKRTRPLPGKMLAQIRYTQASMKNAYGLRYLYNFLNIPFLFLQRETLEAMLEANKRDIELSYQEMDYTGSNKDDSYDSYSKDEVNVQNQNHAFATETKKAAIVSSHGPHGVDGVRNNATPSEQVTPKKRQNSASSDEHNNKMVDTFEEDFDSNDDDVHLEVYSKKLEMLQPEVEKTSKHGHASPISLSLSSSGQSTSRPGSKISQQSQPTPVQTPLAVDSLQTPTGPSIDLDSWLETSAEPDTVNISALKMLSSDEEDGVNPLVAPREGESDDEDENNDKEAVRSNEGSVSTGSSMGFMVLKSPDEQDLDKPKKSTKKATDGTVKKKSKKVKTEGGADDKKKKKKKAAQRDLLVEDLVSPVDVNLYESL